MDLSFTHKVKSINIEEGTFVVEYIPNDPELIPISYNSYVYEKPFYEILDQNGNQVYQNQDDVPFEVNLAYSIERAAPLLRWKRQRLMLDNLDKFDL
jgi:hypothetical protein